MAEVAELRAEVAYWASVAAHGDDVSARLRKELKELRAEAERRRAAREEERRQLLRKLETERSRRWEQSLSLALLLLACVLLIAVIASSRLQAEQAGSECPPCASAALLGSAVPAAGHRPTPAPMHSDFMYGAGAPSPAQALGYLEGALERPSPHGAPLARMQRESGADRAQGEAPAGGLSQLYAEKLAGFRAARDRAEDLLLDEEDQDQDEHEDKDKDISVIGLGAAASLGTEAASTSREAAQLEPVATAAADIRRNEQHGLTAALVARACASMPCMNGGACVAPRPQATGDGDLDGWQFMEGRGACPAGLRPPLPSDIPDVAAAVAMLCEWCIAKLGGGNRLSGSGYGGKIEVETGDPPGDVLCMPSPPPVVTDANGRTAPSYACECARGWAGNNCEEDVDECAELKPCHAGASCFDSTTTSAASDTAVAVGEYRCDCPLGRRGKHCDEFAPECTAVKSNDEDAYSRRTSTRRRITGTDGGTICANGGVCYTADDAEWSSAVAVALSKRLGVDAEGESESLSANGIISRSAPFGSKVLCACAAGWVGSRCDEDLDECASNPCLGGGTCVQGHRALSKSTASAAQLAAASSSISHGTFRCLCPRGRGGSRCEIASAAEYAASSALWQSEAAPSTCTQLNQVKGKHAHNFGAAGFFEGLADPSNSGRIALPPLGFLDSGNDLSQSQHSLGLVTLAFWLRPFSLAQQPSDPGPGMALSGLRPRQVILSGAGGRRGESGQGEPQLYLEDGALIFVVQSEPEHGVSTEDEPTDERRTHNQHQAGKTAAFESQAVRILHRFAWAPPPNEWSHVTVSYGAAASSSAPRPHGGSAAATLPGKGFLDLYVDFHFVESAAIPGSPNLDLRRLRIGSGASVNGLDSGGIATALHGMLASIQIFDRPIRSHREVCDGTTPGLLGWWSFAADDGRTLIDLSENGWHALLETSLAKHNTLEDSTDSTTQTADEELPAGGVYRPAVQPGLGWAKQIIN